MSNKNNKINNKDNIKDLEIEKEKTRQLAILRDIKKIELKLLLEKKYKRKHHKNLDFFKTCIDSDSDDNIDINFDTISLSSSKSKDNSDLEEVEVKG